MCRLLGPSSECDQALLETSILRQTRERMAGLKGDLHYGAIGQGPRVLIGVVSNDSSAAYAVKVSRGMTQWRISEEFDVREPALPPRTVLERPNPAPVLGSCGSHIILFFTGSSSFRVGRPGRQGREGIRRVRASQVAGVCLGVRGCG
jgi:hypothetical protein